MSYQGTLNIVEKLSEDHDVEVQFWADEIVKNILTSPVQITVELLSNFNFYIIGYSATDLSTPPTVSPASLHALS